ncbi:putative cytochrome P450 monooxygenase [Linderina pennispora]|uniref:Putative cytochrome P450 monooxygenase n=1 Tax=Linderina pennispora TaxID=61395 RepID=A0A1Y1VW26_9FUNG|nr:putative cytochrome P450 monooxygenase [Linderina pennispora]ORX65508.1 putative cytochrome P450 monooxygenase [Linderina pennispora]
MSRLQDPDSSTRCFLSPLRNIPGPLTARLTNRRAEVISATGNAIKCGERDSIKYGDIYIYKPNAVSISNPSDWKMVLGSLKFLKSDYYSGIDLFDIQNTLSGRDPKFVSVRKRQLGPYFAYGYLVKMEPTILRCGIKSLKNAWDAQLARSPTGEIEINYSRDYILATMDTIGGLVYGQDFNCVKNRDNTLAQQLLCSIKFQAARSMIPITRYYPFSKLLAPLERPFRKYERFCRAAIAKRRAYLAEGGDKPADLLQGSKVRMDETQIVSESMVMMAAGADTTSNTLLWTTHLFMLYPAVYVRVCNEVREKFAPDHLITYHEAKAHLPYLEACIFETMRLCPIAGGQAPRGHFLPAGTEVYLNFRGVHTNRKTWADPFRFVPERFLDNDESKRNFYAFGGGARTCPGRNLSWVELFTIMANMLKDYELRMPDDLTYLGPEIVDEHGCPKKMDSKSFFVNTPIYPDRDCRMVLSKRV